MSNAVPSTLNARQVKEAAFSPGADLCGISSTERFAGAPEGFRPTDIFPKCRSVIVFARRIPAGIIFAASLVPYTQVKDLSVKELDGIGMRLSLFLEERGVLAVPVPSDDPYEYWEPDRLYGRGILSMRHAGYLAGLGILGKNTLLLNEDYGNMIHIGAVLASAELEQDPLSTLKNCPDKCTICIEACPQKALDGITVEQKLCRPTSFYTNKKGYGLFSCNLCRRSCPRALGKKRKQLQKQI
ncbi:MAG: epoxyqueuosine reductase [Thermacetogeniaceae bacterium]